MLDGLLQLEQRVAALEDLAVGQRMMGDQLAYNFQTAAAKLGISYRTLNREMRRQRLFPLEGMKLIARSELDRWVAERSPVVRPRGRIRINGRPLPDDEAAA